MDNFITVKFDKTFGIQMLIENKAFKDKKTRKQFKRMACRELAKALFENSAVKSDDYRHEARDVTCLYFFLTTAKKSMNFYEL